MALFWGDQPSWFALSPLHGTCSAYRKSKKVKVKLLSYVQLFVTPGLEPTRLLCPGILQARILEWVAISFSRGSSRPRDQTPVSCIAGRCFTLWATGEAHLQESTNQTKMNWSSCLKTTFWNNSSHISTSASYSYFNPTQPWKPQFICYIFLGFSHHSQFRIVIAFLNFL